MSSKFKTGDHVKLIPQHIPDDWPEGTSTLITLTISRIVNGYKRDLLYFKECNPDMSWFDYRFELVKPKKKRVFK